jgi:transposase
VARRNTPIRLQSWVNSRERKWVKTHERRRLYSSHLNTWRRQRDAGAVSALGQSRGRKPDPDKQLRQEIAKLEAEIERLNKRLGQAEAIIDVQKKLCTLLQLDLPGRSS